MKPNILDVTSLLVLAPAPVPHLKNRHHSAKSLSGARPHTGTHHRCYEIVNGRQIRLYRGRNQVDCFEYAGVHCGQGYAGVLAGGDGGQGCRVVVVTGGLEGLGLVQMVGKGLLEGGEGFRMVAVGAQQAEEGLRRGRSVTQFSDQRGNHREGAGKEIKFVNDLKTAINQLRRLESPIDRVWFHRPNSSLVLCFLESPSVQPLNLFEQLSSEYSKQYGISKHQQKFINYEAIVLTTSEIPESDNLSRVYKTLSKGQELKQKIRQYGSQLKIIHKNVQIQEMPSNFSKETYKKTVPTPNLIKQNKQNLYVNGSSEQISSQDQSSQSPQPLYLKTRKNSLNKMRAGTDEVANIMAENIYLKRQLYDAKMAYEEQSRNYIDKTKRKLEYLREEKSICLQQNGKLREVNRNLAEHVDQLRRKCEVLLAENELIKQNENAIRTLGVEDGKKYQNQLAELYSINCDLKAKNQALQKQINKIKSSQSDLEARWRQKIQELTLQIQSYRKFSEQIKVAYQDLERQSSLDKNRLENLEKRCKKYQETLGDLVKVKNKHAIPSDQSSASSLASSLMKVPRYQPVHQSQITNKQQQDDNSKQMEQKMRKQVSEAPVGSSGGKTEVKPKLTKQLLKSRQELEGPVSFYERRKLHRRDITFSGARE